MDVTPQVLDKLMIILLYVLLELNMHTLNYYCKKTMQAWFHYGLGGRTKGRLNIPICKDNTLIDRCGLNQWVEPQHGDMRWPSVAFMTIMYLLMINIKYCYAGLLNE